MKFIILTTMLLALAGCDFDTPLPQRCDELGVAVGPDDQITGKIVAEHVADLDTVRARCQDTLTKEKFGCAIPVNEGEYVLWYVDDPNIRDHERCHGLYEAGDL